MSSPGTIIGSRSLPPGTCNVITDTWAASLQVVQLIAANPSDAIVYVQAPPGNPGSPWARLQPPSTTGGGAANV